MIRSLFPFSSSHPRTTESDEGRIYEALKQVSRINDLILLEDAAIFGRRESAKIPLLLFDPFRGLFVFDVKSWDYPYLKNAEAKAAVQRAPQQNNIRVDAHRALITQRLNEVLHHDGCAVTNFVILEKLSETEFDQLDDSFAALMPKHRVLFADESPQSILQKLSSVEHTYDLPLDPSPLLAALFVQFAVLPEAMNPKMQFASAEQRRFITRPLQETLTQVVGPYGSGKSTLLLLKAVYEKLKEPQLKIVLLEPTLSACEAQKRRLMRLGEHALLNIDDVAIEILTPQDVIEQHYSRLYKNNSDETRVITPKMMKSSYDIADLILCDDAALFEDVTIRYLIHIQAGKRLVLAAAEPIDEAFSTHALSRSFRCAEPLLSFIENPAAQTIDSRDEESVRCIIGNPYLLALVRLTELLRKKRPEEILILCADTEMAAALCDEVNAYFGETAALLPTPADLQHKKAVPIMRITEIENASGLESSAVLLCGICHVKPELLHYALGRAGESLSIIMDETCEGAPPLLQRLKESLCQK